MKKVVYRAVLIVISLVGITNIVDSIIASNIADASTSGLTMSATINPSSTITINADSVSLDITPSASGTLKSSDALRVSAYTNTNYDCNVTMTASSSSLVSGANSIPSLATGTTYTDATFTNDSWGYKIGTNGEYKSVLAGEGANAIKTISSMTGGTANTTDIFFAAKLTPATKPGTYTNTVTFASTCVVPPPYMQDVTSAQLATLMPIIGDTTTVIDKRDEKEYLIGKLADGNYWMLDNLALDPTTVSLATLQGNTNATNTELNYLKNGGGTSSDQYPTSGVTNSNWTASNSYYTPLINATYKNTTTTSWGPGSGKIGVYYNYCAVSAGTYCYNSGNGPLTTITSDICSSNWRLPSSDEYTTLIGNYNLAWDDKVDAYIDNGSATGYKYNLSTPLSGDVMYTGSVGGIGYNGGFYTSRTSDEFAIVSDIEDSYVYSGTGVDRTTGYSVRCMFGS